MATKKATTGKPGKKTPTPAAATGKGATAPKAAKKMPKRTPAAAR